MNIWTRIKQAAKAFYEGARWSPKRSTIPGALQSMRQDYTKATRETLQNKSRYFERNNPIYNRIADLWELYIAGSGLPLIPDSADAGWNERAGKLFEQWSDVCDFTGRQSFGTLQSLWARSWFVDGEVFIVLTRGESSRPRLQTIEAHLCSTPPDKTQDASIVDGVQIDGNGRVQGYWFRSETQANGKATWAFVERQNVIHLFEPSRPGQYRGLPLCHAVLNELHDLDDLHLLEMQAAKENAKVSRYIMTATGELPDDADTLRIGGETTDADGQKRFQYYKDTIGSEVHALYENDKVIQFASERPSVVTREYWKYKTELVCSGIGIPYVMVFPDSLQGTVYRGALDMAAMFFRARHATFAAVLRRVYTYWASTEQGVGVRPADHTKVSIMPPRAPNVDVGRNSTAMLAELAAGATTYDAIYGPLGENWREAFRKLKAQQDYAREIGLVLPGEQPAGTTAPQGGTPNE